MYPGYPYLWITNKKLNLMSYSETIKKIYLDQLDQIKDAGIFKEERFIHSSQAADIVVEFPSGSSLQKVINMCANNYLGLSSHPEVVKAAHDGLDTRGYGMSSVRFICGTQDIHRELENRVTEFLGTEDTILFPSCMDANAGVFEAVLSDQDVMISDRLVHASIIDGIRLCSAMHDTYKHSNMEHLESKLQLHSDKRFKMVITDGVFSMDGDTAKLAEMAELCEKYDAMLAYQVNGSPLKQHDGFPFRLIAVGKYGYKWAKWVNKLEVINKSRVGYWEGYGYSDRADVPIERRRYYEGSDAKPLEY